LACPQTPQKLDNIGCAVWCDALTCDLQNPDRSIQEAAMTKTAFIFPGQGSQSVGMGKALAEAYPVARAVFDEVDAALSQNLSHLMFEGPLEELTLTANAQPALMAVSMAAMRVLETEAGVDLKAAARCVAGHSLGEYSALAAAESLGIGDAARLLRIRGNAMQAAVPAGMGAMAALLGLDFETADAIAKEAAQGEVCQAANDNGGWQVVVSGHRAAVERAIVLAQARGAKRAMLLPVSAPFHCSLMQPAADAMAEALARVKINTPAVSLVANVKAGFVSDPAEIRDLLVKQVTGTVRWRESVQFMAAEGVTHFVEIGAGRVLNGLVKRIAEGATAAAVGTPADIAAFQAAG
jgi:[acyl-carrier-protein] S-malonyltransferase